MSKAEKARYEAELAEEAREEAENQNGKGSKDDCVVM